MSPTGEGCLEVHCIIWDLGTKKPFFGLLENRLYTVCTIPKNVTASLQQAAESAPHRFSEWHAHGEYRHKGFSVRMCCWAPLYLPDMFAALSYP